MMATMFLSDLRNAHGTPVDALPWFILPFAWHLSWMEDGEEERDRDREGLKDHRWP